MSRRELLARLEAVEVRLAAVEAAPLAGQETIPLDTPASPRDAQQLALDVEAQPPTP